MESNTQFQQEGDESDVQILAHHSKRKREDSQQLETPSTSIKLSSLFRLRTADIEPCLENLIKKVVKDVVESKLFQRPIISYENGTCGAKLYRLVFKKELPATIFTLSKIKAKDGNPVEVALYNIKSECIVDEGPFSSLKIEICVLNGEFGSDGTEDWSAEEFMAKIERQRDNKGHLLKGDRVITLKHGLGYIHNLEFTDNSRWTRSGHFMLGAKAVQSTCNETITIREATTAPFVVKDRRGETKRKHFPPSPKDEVWRLRNISKDGKIHNQLSLHEIHTVGDLLQLHETNPSFLQEILCKLTTNKRLEAIIEHAKTSVAEATFDGQNYNSQNILNSNARGVVAVQTTTHDLGRTLTGIQTVQSGVPDQDLQQQLFLITQQEEIPGHMMPLNWPGLSTNIDDGNGLLISESEIDQLIM